jgi:hypothetical protein
LGTILLDDENACARISLPNFKLTCMIYLAGVGKAYVFSSAAGGRWTAGSAY